MLNMCLMVKAMDKDVIKVDDDKLYDERVECLVHYPYECARSIRQPKQYQQPFIEPFSSFECGLPLITNPHPNLVVPTLQI